MIETLVIDDEKLARTLLANYIEKVPQLKLIAECKDAIQASEILQKRKIDLIFLDIQMPELTGIEFLNTLQDPPLVIFTTAYPDYALKGFELDAVDYLLKPFRFDRFLQAVNKAVRRITLPRHGNSDNEYILIKSDYKIFKVLFDDIDFIEGMREYVAYHLTDRKLLAYETLKNLEETLPKRFLRIHKSFIIHTKKVTAIDASFIYIKEIKIPIGGNYKDMINQQILNDLS